MACDLCGKVGVRLESLREMYRTDAVADICDECDSVVSGHLRKVQGMTGNIQRDLMQRFIRNRKLTITGASDDR
jgi:hypothetical protein